MRQNQEQAQNKKPIRKMMILFIVFFLVIMACRALGSYLIVSSELQYANAIVVLSGGDESRMQEALRLYNENYADLIVLTETGNVVEGFDHLHSFDMRIELLNNGVPSGNIILTDQITTSTEEEAQAAKNLLTNRQLTSCIVVTDPYHTRRAFMIFNNIFADLGIKVMIHPTSNHWYTADRWFLKANGWRFTILEYIKLVAYALG